MYTKNAVSVLLHNKLHKALHVLVSLRARVSEEGEFANLVLCAFGLEFLFILANPGNLGMCVHDRGDDGVVDVPMT